MQGAKFQRLTKIEQILFYSLYFSSTLVTCLPSLLLASDFHYLSFFLFVPSLFPLPLFLFFYAIISFRWLISIYITRRKANLFVFPLPLVFSPHIPLHFSRRLYSPQ